MNLRFVHLAVAAWVMSVGACSSSSSSSATPSTGPDPDAGASTTDAATSNADANTTTSTDSGADTGVIAPTSTPITAAAGGSVPVPGGKLTIPAGALNADLTITVAAAAPDAATPLATTVIGNVYDLGPTGTTFKAPVVLSLSVGTVPQGKHAVISVLSGASWVDLPSVVSGGKAYASLEHFSQYAVRGVDVAQCADFDTKVRCGTGSLVGTWTASTFCNGNHDTYEFPTGVKMLAACADTGQATPITGGTVTLNADMSTSSTLVKPAPGTLTVTLGASCTSAAASCDAIAAQVLTENAKFTDATCTGTPAAGCACTAIYAPPVLPAPVAGVYATNGAKLGVGSIPERFFCVDAAATPQELRYSWGSESGTGTQFGWAFTK